MLTLLFLFTQNYGAFYENVEVGVHGPVELVAENSDGNELVLDLSNNKWHYKVGLHGEHEKHYSYHNSAAGWYTDSLPTHRAFVWYKV